MAHFAKLTRSIQAHQVKRGHLHILGLIISRQGRRTVTSLGCLGPAKRLLAERMQLMQSMSAPVCNCSCHCGAVAGYGQHADILVLQRVQLCHTLDQRHICKQCKSGWLAALRNWVHQVSALPDATHLQASQALFASNLLKIVGVARRGDATRQAASPASPMSSASPVDAGSFSVMVTPPLSSAALLQIVSSSIEQQALLD